jgi:hypothetical protein
MHQASSEANIGKIVAGSNSLSCDPVPLQSPVSPSLASVADVMRLLRGIDNPPRVEFAARPHLQLILRFFNTS